MLQISSLRKSSRTSNIFNNNQNSQNIKDTPFFKLFPKITQNTTEKIKGETQKQVELQIFTKGNFAIAILGEIILSDQSLWISYGPQILLMALLKMDHPKAIIYESSKILLQNFLFKLVTSSKNESSFEAQIYKKILKLLSISGRNSLWIAPDNFNYYLDRENSKIIHEVVYLCLSALNYIQEFEKQFFKKILSIVLKPNIHYHYICRCLQFFRSSPKINSNSSSLSKKYKLKLTRNNFYRLTWLLFHHINQRKTNLNQSRVILEIVDTLIFLIENSDVSELLKVPEIFWIGCVLLSSSVQYDFSCGIQIFSLLFDKIDFTQTDHLLIFEESFPNSWINQQQTITQKNNKNTHSPIKIPKEIPKPKASFTSSTNKSSSTNFCFPGIAIQLLKGFCSQQNELNSRNLMKKLILIPSSFLIDEFTDRSILVFILSLFPSLIAPVSAQEANLCSHKIYLGLESRGYSDLANHFKQYTQYPKSKEGFYLFTKQISSGLASIFFPKYEIFTFSFLLNMIQDCSERYRKTLLQFIDILISFVDFSKSSLGNKNISIFIPILQFINSSTWSVGLSTLKSLLLKSKQFVKVNDDNLTSSGVSSSSSHIENENFSFFDEPSSITSLSNSNSKIENLEAVISNGNRFKWNNLSSEMQIQLSNALKGILGLEDSYYEFEHPDIHNNSSSSIHESKNLQNNNINQSSSSIIANSTSVRPRSSTPVTHSPPLKPTPPPTYSTKLPLNMETNDKKKRPLSSKQTLDNRMQLASALSNEIKRKSSGSIEPLNIKRPKPPPRGSADTKNETTAQTPPKPPPRRRNFNS